MRETDEPRRLRGESEEQFIGKLQAKRLEIIQQNMQLEKDITEITKRIIQNEVDVKRRTIHSNLSSHTTASTVGSAGTGVGSDDSSTSFEPSGIYASDNPKFVDPTANE